ncbi:MAG: hypothetical protein MUE81_17925 [Thermoflexibacter sp.]|jgi:hypothetical protein|nr:hypothetical protein [Thermoflexibacter sp.]
MTKELKIIRYHTHYQENWNKFVSQACNATFLFYRNFMDYHSDRYIDHSLMLFSDNELIAIFPANEQEDTIYSHKGLTYGGIAYANLLSSWTSSLLQNLEAILSKIITYYQNQGFKKLIFKEIPFFYAHFDFSKILRIMKKVAVVQEDIGAVMHLQKPFHYWHGRKQSIKKASLVNPPLKILSNAYSPHSEEHTNKELPFLLSDFWNEVLIPQLKNKYHLTPTHSLAEITLLALRFPKNIKQYNVYYDNSIVAGTTIFENNQVVHCQYVSSNDLGRKLFASDLLFHYLITEKYKNFHYLSFGISNEHGSNLINQGLLAWKMSWGAQTCEHLHWEIDLEKITH